MSLSCPSNHRTADPEHPRLCHRAATCVAVLLALFAQPAAAQDLAWTESFADDPVVAGRFSVPPGHDADRFTYDAPQSRLTVHYDSFMPTAWYVRPIDPSSGRTLGACDDFAFDVTFTIRSAGFFADPDQFAQIGWGLINTQTTGEDRAGGTGGPYAYDATTFDYFPNVSALYGGPTLGPTIIRSPGEAFFSSIAFTFGDETDIDAAGGEQLIALDQPHTARIAYDAATQSATLTIRQGQQYLDINLSGFDGYGGFDGDPTTIQTSLNPGDVFEVDAFALTAWQDTYNPYGASVIADVDVSEITFVAPAILLGDMNADGRVDGADIHPFIDAVTAPVPTECEISRGDFDGSEDLGIGDVGLFVQALL